MAQEERKLTSDDIEPTLLVIDIQNCYMDMMSEEDRDMAMENINILIKLFRTFNYPIIRVYHHSERTGPHPGSEEFEFPASVLTSEDDPKIIKHYGDAFNKTDLDKILKKQGSNTVFLCGLSATGCVMATLIGGHNHDYYSFLVKDAMLSHNLEYTNQVEEIFGAIEMATIKEILEEKGKR